MHDIDQFMADWESSFLGQDDPWKLNKLDKNLEDFRKVWTPEDSLLDVGCHAGHIYNALGRPEKYLGIDRDPKLVLEARVRFGDKFEVGDLFDLDRSADVVLCSRVLMHVPKAREAIGKLLQASRKYCVLFVPVSIDHCEREDRGSREFSYFRTFSPKTLSDIGECVIHKRKPYSTVIYGPRLP